MCMIDGSDGWVTVLHERHPTARIEHKCDECGRPIVVGEKYLNEGYVYEGEKKTHKTCRHCQVVRSWLLSECSGFVYGGVWEDIQEHADHGLRVKLMVAGMSRNWKRKDGRMWPIPRFK